MRKYATLASVSKGAVGSCETPESMKQMLDDVTVYLRRASRMGADIVAFPEVYPQLRASNLYAATEPADGGSLPAIQERARELKLYIVWPRFERHPEGIRNSAVLVGRDGEVVGRYYKVFPTIGEIESGVIPGTRCPVFETDFGTVAIAICFDLNFIELRNMLREQKPDAVIFCSMYRGGQQVHEWAIDLGCNMVTAIAAELGRIVDRGGKLLEMATYESLIAHRINLNKQQLHMDYNWDKMDAMLEKYGSDLTFEYYTQEGRYVIGYEKEDRDIETILCEFGLEPKNDYFARARKVREECLKQAER
ncbi:MAG: carbon-nitrogen hydrolase family protein [Armatimonadetes bacterium]|nr:carbon-nitrogen hydrolase family protein [Armatimonadota bacterium]